MQNDVNNIKMPDVTQGAVPKPPLLPQPPQSSSPPQSALPRHTMIQAIPSPQPQAPVAAQPAAQVTDVKPPKQKKESAILTIDKTGMTYLNLDRGVTIQFPFPQDSVKYMDILNEEMFIEQVKTFIQNNKLPPATIVMIFTEPVLFEKIIPMSLALTQVEKDKLIQKFLDYVPFEYIGSIRFPVANGMRVIAGNLSLMHCLQTAFESAGSTILAAYPATGLPADINLTQGVNAVVGRRLLSSTEQLRAFNMIPQVVQSVSPLFQPVMSKKGGQPAGPQSKVRLFLLAGVFGILLLILGVFAYMTFFASTPTPTISKQKIQK